MFSTARRLKIQVHYTIACRRYSNYIFILVLTPCFNGFRQRQLQEETRIIQVLWFDVPYIRDFTVLFSIKYEYNYMYSAAENAKSWFTQRNTHG